MFKQGDKVVIADLDGYHAWYKENVPMGAWLAGNLSRACQISTVEKVKGHESLISTISAYVPNQFLRHATPDDPKQLNMVCDMENPTCPLCGRPATIYPSYPDYDGVPTIPAICSGNVHYWSWRLAENPTEPFTPVEDPDTIIFRGEGE
jgi:hypothetical protein